MAEDPKENAPKDADAAKPAAPAPLAPTAAAPIDAVSTEPKKPEALAAVDAKVDDAADADEGDDETDERGEPEEDAFRPEAIAKRIEKLGGESDVERQAREEEQKLAERRRLQKKKGKRGLESAASKKLAKIGDKPVKRVAASTAVAADADPLLERTVKLNQWMRDHQRVVGFGVAALVLGAGGLMGWGYLQQKKETDASMVLAAAIADERGRIGDPEKEKEDPDRPKDPRPLFKTIELRRDAALAKYKEVESRFSGTGAAMLARLGEGAILLDKQDADGALSAFNDVKASPLAQADLEVRGRALEGLGFAYEIKAQKVADQKDKLFDEAMKAFKELELTDVRGFKELGMYHQARVFEAKSDKPKAIEILKALRARLQAKPNEPGSFPYLDTVVDDRLATLDPSAVPRKPAHGGMGGMGGGMGGLESLVGPDGKIDTSDPRVMQMIQQQMQQQMQQQGGMPQPPPGKGPPPPPSPKK